MPSICRVSLPPSVSIPMPPTRPLLAPISQNVYREIASFRSPRTPHEPNQGFNGGVGVHYLERLRQPSSAYRQLLPQMLAYFASPGESKVGNGSSSHASSHVSILEESGYGDQTALALGRTLSDEDWILPLPCEWNWQMCIHHYAPPPPPRPHHHSASEAAQQQQQQQQPHSDAPPPRARDPTDSMCPLTPKFLHADCLSSLKGAIAKILRACANQTSGCEPSSSVRVLAAALNEPFVAQVCRRAARLPSLATAVRSRACNSTFLLQRHVGGVSGARFVKS